MADMLRQNESAVVVKEENEDSWNLFGLKAHLAIQYFRLFLG